MSFHALASTRKTFKKASIVALLICLEISSIALPVELDSANLTLTKDTLQSSRLSYAARVKSPTTVGTSEVWIYTSGAAGFRSVSTNGLHIGDLLTIGAGTYTVKGIVDVDQFAVTPALSGTDANDTTPIYLKTKPQHVITFNTASAVPNGFFRVLIPAAASNSNDGTPDESGFDFNTFARANLSAGVASGYSWSFSASGDVSNATASGGANCTSPANYHCFEFHYAGTGGIGTAISLNIGTTAGAGLIAPSPANGHAEGTADGYTYIVRQYDATGTLIDATTGKMAVVESVRVTATVDPTITFQLAGVSSGVSTCGSATTVTSTALSIPFGSLPLNTFAKAATTMTVSTNANYGYAVTVIENDAMTKNGVPSTVGPSIIDTGCDGGACTNTTSKEWSTATNYGFGYAVDRGTAATVSATYAGYNELTRSFSAKQFPSTMSAEAPETVMSSGTVANGEAANVCYRIAIGPTQPAGDYENMITYTATASF